MIQSVADLEEWFAFASNYADSNRSDARRPFDTAAAAANTLFTPAFTDDVLVLFDEVIANPPRPPEPRPRGQGENRPRPGGRG